jgi:hypothetical protein
MEFCSVDKDAWYYGIGVACGIMEYYKGDVRTIWSRAPITYASVVHSTWPSRAMWQTHAPTFNKRQKKNKNKNRKVTLHMLTHVAMRGSGLASAVVCINDEFSDIRERYVIIRSEIWTTNIRSLVFGDIRESVTLWGLIVQSLGCIMDGRLVIPTHSLGEVTMQQSTRGQLASWCQMLLLGQMPIIGVNHRTRVWRALYGPSTPL